MKKIILNIDDTGNLVDDVGALIYSGFNTGGITWKYEIPKENLTLQLAALGYSAADIIKLKSMEIM